ncbi:MAG TPA: hypothetical protein V6D21_15970 [Candidatus Obscuribacterales bacterium]
MDTLLEPQYQELQQLFQLSDYLTEDVLIQRLKKIRIVDDLRQALIASIEGNNRIINKYLFNLPVTYQEPVAWIAPVLINGNKRYAWMIGKIASEISEVRSRFDQASGSVCHDSILMCKHEPKPLIFIEPIAVSDFSEVAESPSYKNTKNVNDFAIFQVGYKDTNGDVEDFDQRLVLNGTLLENNFKMAIARAKKVINQLGEVDCFLLEKQAKLLAMLHAEGHNRGHFAGSWSFDKSKSCLLHEAVEEFRACLNAIKWSEYLELTNEQADLFALGVFLQRFFHYGYQAYIADKKTHESIREISVALMFFETLHQAGVFCIDIHKSNFNNFDLAQLKPALIATLYKLNQQEFEAKNQGIDGLREVGRYWYQLAYPNSNFSPEAQSIYNHLRDLLTIN